MNLTVHIGTTKTGSTSIQSFLHENRVALEKMGILVPISLGRLDHRSAVISVLKFGQSADLMSRKGIADADSLELFRQKTKKDLRRELIKNPKEVVITSEHFHSRSNVQKNVELFKKQFTQCYEKTRIIVYVRPQLDQLISLYSTTLRNGFSDTLKEHFERHMKPSYYRYFDLRGLIERWSNVFGADNVLVRPYKALPSKEEGGVVADFCELLDVKYDNPCFASRSEVNVSISKEGQDLLRIVNENPGIDRERRLKVISWLEMHCAGKGAAPDFPSAKIFQSQFTEGNAWVVEKFFPDHPEYLEPRWPTA